MARVRLAAISVGDDGGISVCELRLFFGFLWDFSKIIFFFFLVLVLVGWLLLVVCMYFYKMSMMWSGVGLMLQYLWIGPGNEYKTRAQVSPVSHGPSPTFRCAFFYDRPFLKKYPIHERQYLQ